MCSHIALHDSAIIRGTEGSRAYCIYSRLIPALPLPHCHPVIAEIWADYSSAPCLNRRRFGFLCSMIESNKLNLQPYAANLNLGMGSTGNRDKGFPKHFFLLPVDPMPRFKFAAALGVTQDLNFSTDSTHNESIYATGAGPPSCVGPATRLRAKPTVHLLIIHEFLRCSCLFELDPPCWQALITISLVSSAAIPWRRNSAGGPIAIAAIAAIRGSGGHRMLHRARVNRGWYSVMARGWCRVRGGSGVSASCHQEIGARQRERG
jgi:hypothetical protein